MWHTSYIFQVLMVEIVKFYHLLSRTLFSKQQTNILHFLSLQSEQSHLWSLSISYPFRHAAEKWQTSYIFQVLEVKIVKCDHSVAHTLFGTQQKCDIHRRTLFRFAEWNSLVIFCPVLYSARSLNVTDIVRFFFLVYRVKKSKVWSLFIWYSFGTQQKCDLHRTFFGFRNS